jgi:hypothetical protein
MHESLPLPFIPKGEIMAVEAHTHHEARIAAQWDQYDPSTINFFIASRQPSLAHRFKTDIAAMVVHSFSAEGT